MAHEKTATVSHSAVDSIIGALSQLEADIDGMNARVDEMKRRMMARSNEQVEKLKQQITALASEEAKKIVDGAKTEADAESEKIAEMGRASVAGIKKNINSSFDRAVDSIVKTVLGDTTPALTKADTKSTQPAKIKKYTADGKPIN